MRQRFFRDCDYRRIFFRETRVLIRRERRPSCIEPKGVMLIFWILLSVFISICDLRIAKCDDLRIANCEMRRRALIGPRGDFLALLLVQWFSLQCRLRCRHRYTCHRRPYIRRRRR